MPNAHMKNQFSQNRRNLLGAASAAILSSKTKSSNATKALQLASPFSMGVASGDPSPSGFVIWTRIFANNLANEFLVKWKIISDLDDSIVVEGDARCEARFGHSVHVEISGMNPKQNYRYQFILDENASPIGRTRTLPNPDDDAIEQVRIAFASCQYWETGYYAAYRSMLADKPDIVMFLGDYIYEYASLRPPKAVRTHNLKKIKTLQDYRDRYALYRSDPDLQAMHAACPWLITWDDHDVEDGYSGNLSNKGADDFKRLRRDAYQAFYENMPVRKQGPLKEGKDLQDEDEFRIYGAYDFGLLARIHILDNRQYRSPPPCVSVQTSHQAAICQGPIRYNETMLGNVQERWLYSSMAACRKNGISWQVFGQQTRFTPADYRSGGVGGQSVGTWSAYPKTRQRMIDHIFKNKTSGALILGGDIHQNWVADVHLDPYDVSSPYVASEFCGTSISSPATTTTEITARLKDRNPHCLLANPELRGYGLVTIRRESTLIELRVVEDVRYRNSATFTLSTFTVKSGNPRIKNNRVKLKES